MSDILGEKSHRQLIRYLNGQDIDDLLKASVVFFHEGMPVRMSALRYLAYAHANSAIAGVS